MMVISAAVLATAFVLLSVIYRPPKAPDNRLSRRGRKIEWEQG